ncbi:hypothetical protein QFC24_000239 [Naganishia onofrii]|uniref:Uncharacterized protein n=1 Tax=Naganishia onofrii TaxID=1851511 RepID=A0ACC2XWC4_9TREE|nr:hypothetical protein QFC24_000239 [Naganishia onofrii]
MESEPPLTVTRTQESNKRLVNVTAILNRVEYLEQRVNTLEGYIRDGNFASSGSANPAANPPRDFGARPST